MTSFLVVYDRETGAVDVRRFPDAADAMAARMEYEAHRRPVEEVVVLSSDSEASLRKTHSRYFNTVADILRSSSDALKTDLAPTH